MSQSVKRVAKLVVVDKNGSYLLLQRSNHPTFGNDPDLPGGTLEDGEVPLQTMLREVQEEIGVTIDATLPKEVYSGTEYSQHGTHYTLYFAKIDSRPEVVLSWEHSGCEWLSFEEFIEKVENAKDTYLHMVADAKDALRI